MFTVLLVADDGLTNLGIRPEKEAAHELYLSKIKERGTEGDIWLVQVVEQSNKIGTAGSP